MTDIAIGIDIGGTNTVFSCITSDGKCLVSGNIPTQTKEHFEDYIDDLILNLMKSIDSAKEEMNIIGVGIGFKWKLSCRNNRECSQLTMEGNLGIIAVGKRKNERTG